MDEVKNLINEAKKQGFTVYAPKNLSTYFYITDGEKIGYCQHNHMRGPSYATVHKPNKTTGTGFAAKSFNEALTFAPPWAYNLGHVKKYANWQEFAKKHWQELKQY